VQEEAKARPWWARSKVWWRIVRDVVSLALALALIVWGLPRIAGVGWPQILEPLRNLHQGMLALLALLQLSALLLFTFTITGALPGISHPRALTVNLAGSLVANTLPFGGALAIGATYAMCRSWGFSRSAIGISVVLGGIFGALAFGRIDTLTGTLRRRNQELEARETSARALHRVSVALASLMGYPPAVGLIAGSAALSGGHGTVLAWGPIIGAKFDVPSASAMGAAAATLRPQF